jgi:tetratricopeptide (TPR) repeat protein
MTEITFSGDVEAFERACKLREEGKLKEALEAFTTVATNTADPVDGAGVLLNAAGTATTLGDYESAKHQLTTARRVLAPFVNLPSGAIDDHRIRYLRIDIEIAEAELSQAEGRHGDALARLDRLLDEYRAASPQQRSDDEYEIFQTQRAFLLVDLHRYSEALPILEEARSFKNRKELVTYFLGHTYVALGENLKGSDYLIRAIEMGLQPWFEFRAQCSLGRAYYKLHVFREAKLAFEKCAATADPVYIRKALLWEWLAATCRNLGLVMEAQHYEQRAKPS